MFIYITKVYKSTKKTLTKPEIDLYLILFFQSSYSFAKVLISYSNFFFLFKGNYVNNHLKYIIQINLRNSCIMV